MVNGYNNRILDIDLDRAQCRAEELPAEVVARFLGGRGLGVHYLTRRRSAADTLVFAAGGLSGSTAPTNGRFSVTFHSPLTHTIASANSGGFWGAALKRGGWDVLIVHGRSPVPVYLTIGEAGAEILPATDLWGLAVPEVSQVLKKRHEAAMGKCGILTIGPAGENGVLFAGLMNEVNRTAGRGGPGAVMGGMNLKAIVTGGGRTFSPALPEVYQSGLHQADKLLRSMPVTARALVELGTAGLVRLIYDHDMLPHRNFQDVSHNLDEVMAVSGEALRREIFVSRKPCHNCRVGCGRRTRVEGREGEGPEYESIALLGPNLGIYDIREVALVGYTCNEMGMDTISFGSTVGLAMELYEKGLLSRADTDGLEPTFGRAGIVEKLARLTARRQGFGALLADGARRLAERCGAPHLAMAVKGLEFPGYEPRATMAQALGYATSPRGGCHLQGGYAITLGFFGGAREVDRFLIDTTAGHVVNQQDSGCIADTLGICRFSSFAFGENELSRLYSGYTGLNLSPHDLELAAHRIQAAERRFNLQAGFTRADDTLPPRMFTEKIHIAGEPRCIDREAHFEPLLNKYYEIRGWDGQGVPPAE